jgi:hypothetical protein
LFPWFRATARTLNRLVTTVSERALSQMSVAGREPTAEARTSRGLSTRWFRLNRFRALNQVARGVLTIVAVV